MTYYTVLKFKRRTWPVHIVPPALVLLFLLVAYSAMLSQWRLQRYLSKLWLWPETLNRKRSLILKDEDLPFWEFAFYTRRCQNLRDLHYLKKNRKMNRSSALSAAISAICVGQEPRRFTTWHALLRNGGTLHFGRLAHASCDASRSQNLAFHGCVAVAKVPALLQKSTAVHFSGLLTAPLVRSSGCVVWSNW